MFCNVFITYKRCLCATPMKKLSIKKNKDVILKRAKDYYENNNESLIKQTRGKYRIYLKKKKIKRDDMEKRYHSMSKGKKQKLREYQKMTVRLKSLNLIINKVVS